MKVIHFNYFSSQGGASIATQRLLNFLANKIETTSVFGDSLPGKSYSDKIDKIWHLPFKQKGVLWSNGRTTHPSLNFDEINLNYDLLHLHWINNGFISIKALQKIKKPIVWTLHDLWPVTGGCHIPGDCPELKKFCQNCPKLNYKFLFNIAALNQSQKKLFFKESNVHFIAPSEYIFETIHNLKIIPQERIHLIRNGMPDNAFENSQKIKKSGKKIILFGAMAATRDTNKGFDLLRDALNQIQTPKNEIELHIFGNHEEITIQGFNIISHGFLKLEEVQKLYSKANVTVIPSRYESFCQVALESLIAQTPVVSFDASGTKDIVKHFKNGYLARAFDTKDFANGIDYLLNNRLDIDIQQLKSKFSMEKSGNEILNLYQELVRSDKDTSASIKDSSFQGIKI